VSHDAPTRTTMTMVACADWHVASDT